MKYLSLLNSVSEITIDLVGGVEWAWINSQPYSPTILKAWRDAGLVEDYKVNSCVLTKKARKLLEG